MEAAHTRQLPLIHVGNLRKTCVQYFDMTFITTDQPPGACLMGWGGVKTVYKGDNPYET